MLHQSVHAAIGDLPTNSQGPSFLITSAIFGVLLLAVAIIGTWVGIKVIGRSDKQKPQQSMNTGANVFIGVGIIVLCMGGAIVTLVVGALNFFVNA